MNPKALDEYEKAMNLLKTERADILNAVYDRYGLYTRNLVFDAIHRTLLELLETNPKAAKERAIVEFNKTIKRYKDAMNKLFCVFTLLTDTVGTSKTIQALDEDMRVLADEIDLLTKVDLVALAEMLVSKLVSMIG